VRDQAAIFLWLLSFERKERRSPLEHLKKKTTAKNVTTTGLTYTHSPIPNEALTAVLLSGDCFVLTVMTRGERKILVIIKIRLIPVIFTTPIPNPCI
jgi:hypothetical protein